MKLYAIIRNEPMKFEADLRMLFIVAKDEKHAERLARLSYPSDLRKTKLKVIEVDLTKERILFVDIVGEYESYDSKDIEELIELVTR